jgi:hypothetical protein
MKKILLFICLIAFLVSSFAQEENKQVKNRKNTVRLNMTPLIFNSKNLTFGYERLLKNSKSFSINAGFFILPKLFNNDNPDIYFVQKSNRVGYTFAADFRFYLKKLNKRPAPAGVYIGPYFAQYRYGFDNTLEINIGSDGKASMDVDAGFSMTSLGFELGYQFVFWERLTLDLILVGPSISYYSGKVNASADFELEEGSDAYEYIRNELIKKISLVGNIYRFRCHQYGRKI